jgi:hypothetical protein
MNSFEFEMQEKLKQDQLNFIYETMGVDIRKLFLDPEITEIMLNLDGYIWIEKYKVGTIKTDIFIDTYKGMQILELIAAYDKKEFNKENPMPGAIFPTGERVQGWGYDVTGDKPSFSIRKPATKIIEFDEYVENGVLTKEQKEYLIDSMKEKKNILVVGGTSSGKTTFLNACIHELEKLNNRIFYLEDQPELKTDISKNNIKLATTDNINLMQLLRTAMRGNPDRIVIGEIRTGDVMAETLKAWNSGHSGGLSTIHANGNAISGLLKVEQYLEEIPLKNQGLMIAQTIDIVVNLQKIDGKRVIKEISEVLGYDKKNEEYIINTKWSI